MFPKANIGVSGKRREVEMTADRNANQFTRLEESLCFTVDNNSTIETIVETLEEY